MSAAETPSTAPATPESAGSGRRAGGVVVHAAAWAFVFLILRIFAVCGYSWDTSFAVSTTLGLNEGLSILFGSLMAGHLLTSLLLAGVLPLLIGALLWGPPEHRPVVLLLASLGTVIVFALTVSFHSWWLPLTAAALLGLFALVRRLPRRHRLRRVVAAAMARVSWVAGVAVLFVAAFVPTPWVPRERIDTSQGVITGYVLSVDPGYLNVLTDDHRFVILNTADVRSRR